MTEKQEARVAAQLKECLCPPDYPFCDAFGCPEVRPLYENYLLLRKLQRIGEAIETKVMLCFTYTNWRGETATRSAQMDQLRYAASDHHREKQWLAEGFDYERRQSRTYAVKDMVFEE